MGIAGYHNNSANQVARESTHVITSSRTRLANQRESIDLIENNTIERDVITGRFLQGMDRADWLAWPICRPVQNNCP